MFAAALMPEPQLCFFIHVLYLFYFCFLSNYIPSAEVHPKDQMAIHHVSFVILFAGQPPLYPQPGLILEAQWSSINTGKTQGCTSTPPTVSTLHAPILQTYKCLTCFLPTTGKPFHAPLRLSPLWSPRSNDSTQIPWE